MDSIKIKGIIEITIVDAKTKEIVKRINFTNLLTNDGFKMHRNWACAIPPLDDPNYNVDTRITHIAVGDGNSAPAVTQTALDNELLKKELHPTPDAGCGLSFDGNSTAVFTILIDETELNGEIIREIGLYSETFTPFMVSRFLCGNLSKNSSIQIIIQYKFIYSN